MTHSSAIPGRAGALFTQASMRQPCMVQISQILTPPHMLVRLCSVLCDFCYFPSAAPPYQISKVIELTTQKCELHAFFGSNHLNTRCMYRYCLSVNRCDTVNASTQQSLDDSVDMFSRQIMYICFDEIKPHELFIDAVKRTCASAAQIMNYIDSLPLAPKRASGAFGSKG